MSYYEGLFTENILPALGIVDRSSTLRVATEVTIVPISVKFWCFIPIFHIKAKQEIAAGCSQRQVSMYHAELNETDMGWCFLSKKLG